MSESQKWMSPCNRSTSIHGPLGSTGSKLGSTWVEMIMWLSHSAWSGYFEVCVELNLISIDMKPTRVSLEYTSLHMFQMEYLSKLLSQKRWCCRVGLPVLRYHTLIMTIRNGYVESRPFEILHLLIAQQKRWIPKNGLLRVHSLHACRCHLRRSFVSQLWALGRVATFWLLGICFWLVLSFSDPVGYISCFLHLLMFS